MGCSSLADYRSDEQEPFDYLQTRQTVLREYCDLVGEKADEVRSSVPDLAEHMDMAQAMTHEFLRHAWLSYIQRAEQRFGKAAVSMALREIVPV